MVPINCTCNNHSCNSLGFSVSCVTAKDCVTSDFDNVTSNRSRVKSRRLCRHYSVACCVHITYSYHLQCPSRSLRSSADTLKIPLNKCKTKDDRAFSYSGPSVWNSLPLQSRNAATIDTFKSALKTYLFNLHESD